MDHAGDPLELGVLGCNPSGGFRGVGYATEGRLRGGGIFEDGRNILPAPAVAIGATLGIEVTIGAEHPSGAKSSGELEDGEQQHRTCVATVRFQVNGQHTSRPVDLGAVVLPIVPVVSLPANAEVQNMRKIMCI